MIDMDKELTEDQNHFEILIKGLIEDDYGVCDNFIQPSTVIGLSHKIQSLYEAGSMKAAGIGNNSKLHNDSKFRRDKINWIEGQSIDEFEQIYLQKINRFIAHLNTTCYTSIKSYESHYASYAVNDFYKRHFDQFKTDKGRQYSIVLYLNDNWLSEDGGMLSLYPKGKDEIQIAPLSGRVVFFKSDEMEHEVHASYTRERRSIAGWMKN